MMLNAYMNEVVILVRSDTPQKWLEPGDTEEKELKARVEWKNQDVRNEVGEIVKSSIMVYLHYDGTLWFSDKIRIDGVDHAILKIDRKQDFSINHIEVYLA